MSGYKKEISTKQFYINILIGALIGAVITFLALLLFAAIMLIFNIDINMSSPLSSVALLIGSGAGGYISAYKNKSKGFLCGLINAGITFLLIAVIGLILSRDITLMSLIHLAVTVLSSLIGGILGVNKADKIKVV